jgi:hypothetical protein
VRIAASTSGFRPRAAHLSSRTWAEASPTGYRHGFPWRKAVPVPSKLSSERPGAEWRGETAQWSARLSTADSDRSLLLLSHLSGYSHRFPERIGYRHGFPRGKAVPVPRTAVQSLGLAVIPDLPRCSAVVPHLVIWTPEHDLLKNPRPPAQPRHTGTGPHHVIRTRRPDLLQNLHLTWGLIRNLLFHSTLAVPIHLQVAGNDASRVAPGTVPGTVQGVVRAVVLNATWSANVTAKSSGSRVATGEPDSTATWMLNCRATGRTSAEGTWKVCCGASRGLICEPVSAVVCAVSRNVRRTAYSRAGSPVPFLTSASGCTGRIRG